MQAKVSGTGIYTNTGTVNRPDNRYASDQGTGNESYSTESTIDVRLNGICITVNKHTSLELLDRVIKVISPAQ